MVIEIKVPPLGESVTEATVSKWLKKEGDYVQIDEMVVELETDKVSLEVTAAAAGTIQKINFPTGSTVAVGQVLGSINESGKPAVKPSETPTPKTETKLESIKSTTQNDILSPAVRKIVAENNVDVSAISGSGKDGRVTKGDVLDIISKPQAPVQYIVEGREERVKMSRLRQRIAERLKDSQNTAAILTTFNEINMSAVMALRAKYKDNFEKRYRLKLGFMSFFVKAVVAALRDVPAVNAEIAKDEIIYKYYYDIGVAVGTDQGLVVPVVRNCDQLSFAEVEKAIGDYGKKARDGKLSMEDLTGGTFTISNGGTYGSLLSTPIINPPQSAILGMHKIEERPVVINAKIEIQPMMYVALSYDHRIIDGKEAVTFLVKVKEYIESPERILLEI